MKPKHIQHVSEFQAELARRIAEIANSAGIPPEQFIVRKAPHSELDRLMGVVGHPGYPAIDKLPKIVQTVEELWALVGDKPFTWEGMGPLAGTSGSGVLKWLQSGPHAFGYTPEGAEPTVEVLHGLDQGVMVTDWYDFHVMPDVLAECTCPLHGPEGLMARGCTCGHLASKRSM